MESNINKLITIQEILKRSFQNPNIQFSNSIGWENCNSKKISCFVSNLVINDKFREGNISTIKANINYQNKKEYSTKKNLIVEKESDNMKVIEDILNEFF